MSYISTRGSAIEKHEVRQPKKHKDTTAKMRKKKDKKRVDTDIREQVREIMRGRRELRRARKEAIKNGNWEDIIPMLVVEEDSDVSSYREQMEG